MPRDEDWKAKRNRAKALVRVLATFERNFGEPARRGDALESSELQTLDRCAAEARYLLGDDTLVSPMITELQALLMGAERENKKVSFDIAKRHVGPILAAIEGTYDLSGSSGSWSAAKTHTPSAIVVRIDEADT